MRAPPATRVDAVVDVVHGEAVADPYRWLEEGEADDTRAWVVAQNACTTAVVDEIPHNRAASVAWLPVGSGFSYTRNPEPGSVPTGEEMYHRHVFFHRLGQTWREDEEVFGAGRAREDWPNLLISRDGRWLVVEVA